ncbi:MAG: cation:proton antiporter, partial [Ilumatobacter sp.]
VESGVNDGLAVPVVAVLTAALLGESRSTASWIGFVVRQVGGGVLLGVGLGAAAIFVLRRAKDAGWADGRYTQLATFFVPIVALFGASAMSVNSFIAAFAAGLTFGSVGRRVVGEAVERDDAEMFDEFTEDAAQLFGVAAFFIFGNVLLTDAIDEISWPIVVCALLTLTLGRMLPVWISLTGTGMKAPTRLFLGWFGPRGLASIVFALLLLEDMEAAGEPSEVAESILDVVAITVTASVVLHGASASIGARRYGKWAAAQAEDEMGSDMMDDVDERVLPRSRWSLRR